MIAPPGSLVITIKQTPQQHSLLEKQMKRHLLSAALMTLSLGTAAFSAHAAISNDVIRIGIISDMSGVYSDVDGPAGVEANRRAGGDS